jgi:hypothetical protein
LIFAIRSSVIQPPRKDAPYLSGTLTAGSGFVGNGANERWRGSIMASAKKTRKAAANIRMIEA